MLVICTHAIEKFNAFFKSMNSYHPSIKLEATISDKEIRPRLGVLSDCSDGVNCFLVRVLSTLAYVCLEVKGATIHVEVLACVSEVVFLCACVSVCLLTT